MAKNKAKKADKKPQEPRFICGANHLQLQQINRFQLKLEQISQFNSGNALKITQIGPVVDGSEEMLKMRLLDTKLNSCNLHFVP